MKKIIKSVPSFSVHVPASKMFSYPSKLIDTYTPGIMEVNLPEYHFKTCQIDFKLYKGSTANSEKPFNYRWKKLNKIERKLSFPISLENTYIYEALYVNNWNVSHLLIDLISFLLEIKDIIKPDELTIILPKQASLVAIKFLKGFGYTNILCTNKNIVGNIIEVIVDNNPAIKPHSRCFYSNIFSQLDFQGYQKDTPERVFLSRKGRRKLINEDVVEDFLNKYGFKKVYFEDIPVSEQWSIARNANIVVCVHGAATANLLFNNNAVKVIALDHPGFLVNSHRDLMAFLKNKWCRVTGEITDDILGKIAKKDNYFATYDIRIDLSSLKKALDYMGVT